jgi:hypothetical protein
MRIEQVLSISYVVSRGLEKRKLRNIRLVTLISEPTNRDNNRMIGYEASWLAEKLIYEHKKTSRGQLHLSLHGRAPMRFSSALFEESISQIVGITSTLAGNIRNGASPKGSLHHEILNH